LLVCSILSQGVMAAIYQLILFGMNWVFVPPFICWSTNTQSNGS
jgi:hypothetical protein